MDLLVVDTWSDRQAGHKGFAGAAIRSEVAGDMAPNAKGLKGAERAAI